MEAVSNLIIREQDSRTVFVFPSEAAAVSCRKEFLKLGSKRAVRNDRFISWDRFKERITLHNRTEKPLNSVLRRLFAADLVQRNGRGQIFAELIPGEFRREASAFTDVIMRILPELSQLIKHTEGGAPVFGPVIAADFRRLYDEYRSFMNMNNLFEPSWEIPDLKEIDGRFCIICPEIIEDFGEFEQLLRKAGCGILPSPGGAPRLRLFENSVIEADSVLNEITGLLKAGVHFSGIAVSVADDETAEMLFAKARLRGINLSRRSGKPLTDYPAGRLPELLRDCRRSGYSTDSLKHLLLNRAFIWKDPETATSLIRFGIENRCLKNTSAGPAGDVWANRLRSIRAENRDDRQRLTEFYRRLRAGIEAVCGCITFSELSREFQIFLSSFLETGSEEWSPECEQVFQRTREVLSSLRDTADQLKGVELTDPLALWIELLNEKIYVRQQEDSGIPVYPYRVSALVSPAYHFIIGLTNEASSAVSAAFPFLTDQQRKELGAAENNMTSDFIDVYSNSGHDVRFSCASETPSGAALPPGYFIECDGIDEVKIPALNDLRTTEPFLSEQLWWQKACSCGFRIEEAGTLPELTACQLAGFDYASATFMAEKGFDAADAPYPEDFTENKLLPPLCDKAGGYFRVSATSLDRWTSCPFNLLLSSVLGITEDEYILRAEDPWTAGSVLHDIMLAFFSAIKDGGGVFRVGGGTDEYQALIRESAAEVFDRWERSGNFFYGPAWAALKRRALKDLLLFPAAEAEYYNGLAPLMLEEWLDFDRDDERIRVVGRVDRISGGAEGAVIIDYKRSWEKQTKAKFIREDENGDLQPPEKGYQLPFYILLARENGLDVGGTSYYGITAASHFPVTGEAGVLGKADEDRLCELTMHEILRMAEGCRRGYFSAADRCDGCGYRAVCRKRYNVRWAE